MDLPTYTNIWRIEKRLYKLYDFRLPAPLPITWIAVFAGITVPYIIFLVAIGLPFNHNLVWLYVLPPGVLTWLTTRPVSPADSGAAPGAGDGSPGGYRAGSSGTRAAGHDGVSRRCPGHLAPTASVAALISFTYHLPL